MATYTATPVKMNGKWYAGTTGPVEATTGTVLSLRVETKAGKTWTKDHRVVGNGPGGRKLCEPLTGARKATSRRSYSDDRGGAPCNPDRDGSHHDACYRTCHYR